MAADTVVRILISIPVYIQLPATEDFPRNRHILLTVRLIEIDPDNVRVDLAWNVVIPSASASVGPAIVYAPELRGVHLFTTSDPISTPIYILFSPLNQFGICYHINTAIQIDVSASGEVTIAAEFMQIHHRPTIRSTTMSTNNNAV
ncbi:hypothetical protein FKP32DRAFT_1675215 [Trametes sanguinea]|nr:hypothetical protein FKP32DRAFT_1675215 [Trametes sanguinea]